ncbi:MAG: GNAT family N-acetyltransferase [Desulfobulbus sp.]|nr:GNAT family N-acetyltransferase [Desulfobulbus sp.]
MKFSIMQPGQEDVVINIVKEAFNKSVALGYTQEGIEEFYKFANENSLAERSKHHNFTIIGHQEGKAVGIIEIKDYCHISMFFVKPTYQKKGYGKALFNEAIFVITENSNGVNKLTVNSSLNAAPSYERLGFKTTSEEQCFNGIRFIPMDFILL